MDPSSGVGERHAGTLRLGARAALTSRRQCGISPLREGPGMARAARQRAEILAAIRAGDLDRARILAAEHLLEFPDDDIVRAALRHAGREA